MEIMNDNVNYTFVDALAYLKHEGIQELTRNGMVKASPEPVTIINANPAQRVLFHEMRNANPFFHLMESLWMLAGRRDLGWIEMFNKRMESFSDDRMFLHGAYGWRWRTHFGFDQIEKVATMLRADQTTRRAAIAMWDPIHDLAVESKDIPCNTHIYFRVLDDALTMTVCNRSNDLVWGALGSNVVHFSMLQELLAHEIGVNLGPMYQFTNNLHIYQHHWTMLQDIIQDDNQYTQMSPYPVISTPLSDWLTDVRGFVGGSPATPKNPWFELVARPMMNAYLDKAGWEKHLELVAAEDWKLAGFNYLKRLRHGR